MAFFHWYKTLSRNLKACLIAGAIASVVLAVVTFNNMSGAVTSPVVSSVGIVAITIFLLSALRAVYRREI